MNPLKILQMLGIKVTDDDVTKMKLAGMEALKKFDESYDRLKNIENMLLEQRNGKVQLEYNRPDDGYSRVGTDG